MWNNLIAIIGELDGLMALMKVSFDNPFNCRPNITADRNKTTLMEKMVHPVLMKLKGDFVSNDIQIDPAGVILLSGPNMGGKSTLLRTLSVCLILG